MQSEVRVPVRGTHVLPDPGPPTRSRAGADAVAVLHRAARELMGHLPELTDRILAELRDREPAYRAALEADHDRLWQEVHDSLRNNVSSFFHPRESRAAARRCSWEIGASGAERGLPLDTLLHAFRIGGALVWDDLLEHTARRSAEDVRLLVHIAADVWNFVDEQCRMVADAHHHVERTLAWRRENQVRLMTAALLDGTARVADLPEVAAALVLPESGSYAVLAVAGGPRAGSRNAGPGPLPAPPGHRVLWHPGPTGAAGPAGPGGAAAPPAGPGVPVAAVPGPDRSGAGDPGGESAACHGIVLLGEEGTAGLAAALAPPPGVRVGVSSPVQGLAALGDARRLADTALHCCPREGGTVRLEDRLPAALVLSSPGLGGALAERVLGPLRRLEPGDRDMLLETLTVWLECDGSAPRAASRLYCHRNTVLNRLRRCEQLTGRSLARPADLVELSLALQAARLLHR
ncbi:CdaR family transcriptional regulator [Streptomyces sp. JJ36]|uniref:PucR family transcriptional regulator n=1 Tax=Streptomyces sp. JJ36 TaxID=2736645 RepID=UPI001F46F998|nr:PucR family transcriptional regulator [Streptomyces sp. JJ36]MCF6525703.1 helix-turn-helix domain-containing protein [Streptomyces sp. JJ36]